MAVAANFLHSEALQRLEEQLTCSVCMGNYKYPKILPCFHSFCLDCLRGIFSSSRSNLAFLHCPTCRSPCQVPQQGVDALPSSFNINNLTEIYHLMKKAVEGHTSCDKCRRNDGDRYCKQCAKFLCQQCLQQHNEWISNHETIGLHELVADTVYQQPQTSKPVINCPNHDFEPITIFCKMCVEFICRLCTQLKHKDHDYEIVDDVYSKYKLVIHHSTVQPLNRVISILTELIGNLNRRQQEIAKQGEGVKQLACENNVDHPITEKIDQIVKYKLTVTKHQIGQGEAVLHQLTGWRNYIQGSLSTVTPHQILSTKIAVSHCNTGSLLATIKKSFQPTEQANLVLMTNVPISLEYSVSAIPTVAVAFDQPPMVGQESAVNISLYLEDGIPVPVPSSLISCHLTSSTSDLSPVQCTVKETSQTGRYLVIFTPRTRGYNQLYVTLQDRTVMVSIPVIVPMVLRDGMAKLIKEFNEVQCGGVAVTSDGLVLFCRCESNCITIVTGDGQSIGSFGTYGEEKGQMIYPDGIAVTSAGTLLVADVGNNRIQEFTMDGECLSCVGREGEGPLEFDNPYCIAINQTSGQVYVTDHGNYRVQVLNADLTFSHVFGSYGSDDGQFVDPWGIAIDGQGLVYVIDNYYIQKFTSDGQFITTLPSYGRRSFFVTIDNDLLYVSEAGCHSISVRTTSGKLIYTFDNLEDPIEFSSGYFYLCDQNHLK